MVYLFYFVIIVALIDQGGNVDIFTESYETYQRKYGHFPESLRLEMVDQTKEMFYFAYDNYMKYAYPLDELDPIHCTGRGPDHDNPSNININDVLGDYSLSLVESLGTLAILGNTSEFQSAVQLVIDNVSFDKNNTVQVFEATIRVLGSLLSAHLMIVDPSQPFGDLTPPGYDQELLYLAHDLASRLLPAFEKTATGIPYPRVNLREGVPPDCTNETCTAGAGTLLLEFGVLGRLLGDPVYEAVARRASDGLWRYRSNVTGLFGNNINIQTGEWVGRLSGIGAGIDSFFEYIFKSFIMFGEEDDLHKFNESYEIIKYYLRKGRKHCNKGSGFPPIYVNVDMKNGDTLNNWIDSLQAAWPGLQVLIGDLEEAICLHALHYSLWQRFDSLPERYNWHLKVPEVLFYPLRPELVESTYLLYQATKNPFYLHVGRDILTSLNNHTRAQCGYATIHDVRKKDLEDRMESFFLSETCKYLYLLFDKDNYLNRHSSQYMFSTEGHVFPVHKMFRTKPWLQSRDEENDDKLSRKSSASVAFVKSSSASEEDESTTCDSGLEESGNVPVTSRQQLDQDVIVYSTASNITHSCGRVPDERRYMLPIKSVYLQQVEELVGLPQAGGAPLTCT